MEELCAQCDSKVHFADKANNLLFCTEECQKAFHRCDLSRITANPLIQKKIRVFSRLLSHSSAMIRYLCLCEMIELKDIRAVIMSLYIGGALTVYITPPTVVVTNESITMLHGNGLLSQQSCLQGIPQKEYFLFVNATNLSKGSASPYDFWVVGHTYDWCSRLTCYDTEEKRVIVDSTAKGLVELSSPYSGQYFSSYNKDEDVCTLVRTYMPDMRAINNMRIIRYSSFFNECVVLTEDGSAWKVDNASLPLPLAMNTPCIDITYSHGVTLCVTVEGELWGQGNNIFGQLGIQNTEMVEQFQRIEGLPSIYAVRTNGCFTAAIDQYNNLWVTGENGDGQLGIGNTLDQWRFVKVEQLSDVVSVYCDNSIIIATKRDGSRWASGHSEAIHTKVGPPLVNSTRFVRLDWLPPLSPVK